MKRIIAILFLAVGHLAGYGQTTTPTPSPDTGAKAFKGYFNITDMGLLIGSTQNRHPAPFTFMTTNGWHITEQLSLGIGVGVEFPAGSYLPVVLDARYYIRETAFSPFISLYGGIDLPLDDEGVSQYGYTWDAIWPYPDYKPYEAKGGWLINPGFGIRHMFGENFGILFSVGYRFQRLHYEAGDMRRMIADYNRLGVKFGILFK